MLLIKVLITLVFGWFFVGSIVWFASDKTKSLLSLMKEGAKIYFPIAVGVVFWIGLLTVVWG